MLQILVGFLILLLVLLAYGWLLLACLHYRRSRQEEFLHLLVTAVESGVPLTGALRAYVEDRPHGTTREVWVAVLLFLMLPGYYWFWHRRHSFDRRVLDVAEDLEEGKPLSEALQETPQVVAAEVRLAVAVGEYTGRLAPCLRAATGARLFSVSLETLPRFLYPLLLLFILSVMFGFWLIYLLPRMERIFHDFQEPLPGITARLAEFGHTDRPEIFMLALFLLPPLAVGLASVSVIRWHLPVVGRLYRMHTQSRVLRALSVMLDAGAPLPAALDLLAGSEHFARAPRNRLKKVRDAVEQGQPLAEGLRRGGLLRPAMAPLVQAAERARNLPWALAELADLLAGRAVRLLQRISQVVFPTSVVAIGALVGVVVGAMFMPLVALMMRLSQ
jgi:type II secretory pathway component PulF